MPFPRKGPPSTEFVDYRTLPTRDGSCFSYEKGLEAWICSNIDNPAHAGIRSIFGPPSRLAWFANYLANGINMSNMDFLAFHGGGERVERVSLVELKGESGGSDCAEQLDGYAEWLRNIVFPGEEVIIRKILIARRVSEEALDRVSGMTSGPHWFVSYEIDEGGQVNLQPLNFTPSYP